MKKNVSHLMAILLVVISLSSCQKERQDVVNEEQVTIKDQGNGIVETYKAGPNGVSVFSNWIQKTDPDWMAYGSKWTTDMNTTSLTNTVRDNGLVLVYFNFNGYISQLPNHSMGENLLLDYSFETGKITARYTYGGGAVYGNYILTIKFRYILIPSTALTGGQAGKKSSRLDYSDYNAVCDYYGIPR